MFTFIKQNLKNVFQTIKKYWGTTLIVGIALVFILTFALTQASTITEWLTTSSQNCLTQGRGNTMVENNGEIYVLFGNATNTFRKYDPSTGNCESTNLANFPLNAEEGTKLINIDDDTLYATAGNYSTSSFFYHIRDNFWSFYNRSKADNSSLPQPLSQTTLTQGVGNSIVALNNNLYILNGNGTSFSRYNTATNTWTTLSTLPLSATNGAALTTDGTYIYALRGDGTNFYRYTIDGSWTSMASTPVTIKTGGSLATIGTTDIYALAGGNTRQFLNYNIASNTWTNLSTSVPAPDLVYGGGGLTAIGTKLYALQGNASRTFWEFDTVAQTWSKLKEIPDRIYSGGSLTTDGTYVYATKGKALEYFYRYAPATDTWTGLADSPFKIGSNYITEAKGGIAYIANGPSAGGEIYLSTGIGTPSTCTSSCNESLGRYIVTNNSWPTYFAPEAAPDAISYGGSAAHPANSDHIFILKGINTKYFWKYITSLNSFIPFNMGKINETLPIAAYIPGITATQSTGNSIAKANGKIYQLIGGTYFIEYNPDNNRFHQLPNPPVTISTGGAITAVDDNTLYIANGNYFWKYDIPSETWFNYPIGKTPDNKPITQVKYDNETDITLFNQGHGSTIVEADGELYIIQGNGSQNFWKYSPMENSWMLLTIIPSSISYGSSAVKAGNYIYLLRGTDTATFYRYNILENSWTTMANTPGTKKTGAGVSLTYSGGDYLYALRGRNVDIDSGTTDFFRYKISTNQWTDLTSTSPAPHLVQAGGSIVSLDQNTLYAMSGNGTNYFMRFDITDTPSEGDGTWTDLSSSDPLPATVASGGSLTTDGTYIFALRGTNTNTLWQYDPSAISGARWTEKTKAPINFGSTTSTKITYGGIIYSSIHDDIFAIPGNGYGGFNQNSGNGPALLFRYDISTDTWPHFEKPAIPPGTFGNGASLTYPGSGNHVYAFKGGNTTDFWQYDMTANEWKNIYRAKLDDNTPISQLTEQKTTVLQSTGNSIVEVDGIFYVMAGNSTIFQKYDPQSNTWTNLSATPASVGAGASLVAYNANTLYAFRGASTTFWKYDITADAWVSFNINKRDDGIIFSQAGATQGDGNSIAKMNDPITNEPAFYIAAGAGTTTFQKFNPSTNTWTNLADIKGPIYGGGALQPVGTDIYAIAGSGTLFYKYDTLENTWAQMTSAPTSMLNGSAMAYPGSGNYIYVLAGYNTPYFWRYCVDKTNTACTYNTWSANAYLENTPANVRAGSGLAFIGTDLYAMGGNNTPNFWRYDTTQTPGSDIWDTLSGNQMPATITAGGTLSSDGTYLYATRGNNTNTAWRYDPSAASESRWTQISNVPAIMGSTSTSAGKGRSVYCEDCGYGEIWLVTGNGTTGYTTGANAGLTFRYRIDPQTCNAEGYEPGSGTNPCNAYNSWYHEPTPATVPQTINFGAALAYPKEGNLIYALRGATNNFYAYNTATNSWSSPTTTPQIVNGGGAMTAVVNGTNHDLYIFRGGGFNDFWLYRVTDTSTGTGTWNPTTPAAFPDTTIKSGGSLCNDGSGNIYATAGGAVGTIKKYNISLDSWTDISLPSPVVVGTNATNTAMGGLAWTEEGPSGGPELFLVTGIGANNSSFPTTPGQGLIYRYPISTGINAGSWPISYSPVKQPTSGKTINYGGALTSTNSDSIFAFRGNGTNEFWRYDIGDDLWNHSLPTLNGPTSVFGGASLANNGDTDIYAVQGGNTNNFYQYTISNISTGDGSWSSNSSTPVNVNNTTTVARGGIVYDDRNGGAETVWMSPGYGISNKAFSTIAGLLYRYDITGNEWPHLTSSSNAPENTLFDTGSDLAMDPDNNTIYALRGVNQSYAYPSTQWSSTNSNLWKYAIDTNTWTSLTNMPDNTNPARIGSGGSMTLADATPDTIYALRGNLSKDIHRYTISTNIWDSPANFEFPVVIGETSSALEGGEIIYSPSTFKLFATPGNDTVSPYTIYSLSLENRLNPSLLTEFPIVNTGFDIKIEVLDMTGNPYNVTQNTDIQLTLKTGTGSLGGNLTGTIPNGQNTTIISGVTYNTIENDIVITANDVSPTPSLQSDEVKISIFDDNPTITNVNPSVGAVAGGTLVTITGDNFSQGTRVTFDGIESPQVTFIDETTLIAISPKFSGRTVPFTADVGIIVPSGQTATQTSSFTFNTITTVSVTPSSGATAGGTPIIISGSNFSPDHLSREITITNNNSELLDYQVSFQLDTASLIANKKMRSDCGDLRVLDNDQKTNLNYWIADDTCGYEATKIWTKIPSLPNGGKTIYITYGNKKLLSQSNGNNVFEFFDDFESTTLNSEKWTNTTGAPTLFNGKLVLHNNEGIYSGSYSIPHSTVWETSADPEVTSGRYGSPLKASTNTADAFTTNPLYNITGMFWNTGTLYAETNASDTPMGAFTAGYKNYKITYRPNNANTATFDYNNGASTVTKTETYPSKSMHPTIYNQTGNFSSEWSWTFIRKYGAVEPVTSVGDETGNKLEISINGNPAEDITYIDDTTISAITPSGIIGPADVFVMMNDGRSSTITNGFTYSAPTILSVIPNAGTHLGGTEITINGENFTEGGFRHPVTVVNKTNQTLTDEIISFKFDTATPITANQMQSACQDIRIKDSDHTTYLKHWVENGCNSGYTNIWVKIPQLPPEGTTIYIHYGNPIAQSTGDSSEFYPLLDSANNVLWFKSDAGVTLDGNKVSNWNDVSGSNNHLIQDITGNRPSFIANSQNNRPSIKFDSATNNYLSRTSSISNLPAGTSDRTAFTVVNYDKIGWGGFSYGNTATNQVFGMVISSGGDLAVQGWVTDYATTSDALYEPPLLHSALLSASKLTQWKNGTQIYGPSNSSQNTTVSKIEVGREMDTSPYVTMNLFETLIFNRTLTPEERTQIETYLINKYDLLNTNTYKTSVGGQEGSIDTFSATIDNQDFTSATFINNGQIIAITPAHIPGPVDIEVKNPDSASVILTNGFTYYIPPTVTSINPADGINSDTGRQVQIIGTDFSTNVTRATLQKNNQPDIECIPIPPATDIVTNSTTIDCLFDLDGATIGLWTLAVDIPGVTPVSTLENSFEIKLPPPVIDTLTPDYGPIRGGTTITIDGSNFFQGSFIYKEYPISYIGTALNDFQVMVELNTADLVLDKIRPDCHDIRIFDEDLTTPLPYYIENLSDCGTENALKIWTKIPEIPDGGKNIYVAYGNNEWTTDLSSIENTFEREIDNVVGQWHMDETEGTTVMDDSGNENTGTTIGTVDAVAGKYGYGREFSGSGDYIRYENSATLNPSGSSAEITLEGWVYMKETTTYQALFNKWDFDGYDKSYLFDISPSSSNASLRFYIKDSNNYSETNLSQSSGFSVLNSWHHIAARYRRNNELSKNYISLYINGQQIGTELDIGNYGMRASARPLQSGRQISSYWTTGIFDELRIFNRALSTDEINSLYSNYGIVAKDNPGKVLMTKTSTNPVTVGTPGEETGGPPEVLFGTKKSPLITYIDTTQITAELPSTLIPGLVDITISNNASSITTVTNAFTYYDIDTSFFEINEGLLVHINEPFSVTIQTDTTVPNDRQISISLAQGNGNLGGNLVGTILSGTNQIIISGITYDTTEPNVILKATDTGTGELLNESLSAPINVYAAEPIITAIDPTSGSSEGGTEVTISGNHFLKPNITRPITINNTEAEQTDYQVSFTLDTATPISEGKMRNDAGNECGDLRIMDVDGKTELPYWIEPNTCNTTNTVIWTKIPTINASPADTIIYAKYGNPELTSQSSLSNVFIREVNGELVGYWKMDESEGDNLYDLSGNNHQGIGINTPAITTGKYGNARNFIRSNSEYVRLDTVSADLTNTAQTYAAWIRPTDTVRGVPFGFHTSAGDNLNIIFWSNTAGIYSYYTDINLYKNIDTTLSPNAWHFYTATLSSDNKLIQYIDGVQDYPESSIAATRPTSTGRFSLGQEWDSSSPSDFFQGDIDEVMLFNNTLTQPEIADIANNYGYATTNYPNKLLVKKWTGETASPNIEAVTVSNIGPESGMNGNINVTFNNIPATEVTYIDTNTITATTPPHAAGKVDVKVTNPDGQFVTLADGFEYTAQVKAGTMTNDLSTHKNMVKTSDGNFIVAWRDSAKNIYAQKINTTPAPVWDIDEVQVTNLTGQEPGDNVQEIIPLVADNSGGAYIGYVHTDSSTYWRPYVTHIDSNGTILGTSTALTANGGNSEHLKLASDGSGGIYVSWLDMTDYNIYTTRLSSALTKHTSWTEDTIFNFDARQLDNTTASLSTPIMTTDGTGIFVGSIDSAVAQTITFTKYADNGANATVYPNAITISDSGMDIESRVFPMAADGSGGVIIAYATSAGGDYTYKVKHYNSQAQNNWTTDAGTGINVYLHGTSDGEGGLYLTWGTEEGITYIIEGQHIDQNGNLLWNDGNPVTISDPTVSSIAWNDNNNQISSSQNGGFYLTYTNEDDNIVNLQYVTRDGIPLYTPPLQANNSVYDYYPVVVAGSAMVAHDINGTLGYEYFGDEDIGGPTLTNIDPGSGSTYGGNTVTITGSNFFDVISIQNETNDDFCQSYTVDSSTQITCITAPYGTVGLSDITIVTAYGTPATLADGFEYITTLPTVDTISLPQADTTEDLGVLFTTTPINAKAIIDWKKDQSSIAVLNMPFEQTGSETLTAKDYSDNANNGTVTGATFGGTLGVDGKGAYNFDGNDYIEISASTSLDTGNAVSIEAWVKFNGSNAEWRGIIAHGREVSPYDGYMMVVGSSNNLRCRFGTQSNQVDGSTNLNDGAWHHVACVSDGTNIAAYVDGLVDNLNALGGTISTGYKTFIGTDVSKTASFNGIIDEAKIYDFALTPEQIATIYNNYTVTLTPDYTTIAAEETTVGEDWQACVTPNADGLDGSQACSNEITITALPPTVESISQTVGTVNTIVNDATIIGTNFIATPTVKLTKTGNTDINATDIQFINETSLTADFDLTGAATGLWNIVVTNPDTQSGTLTDGFTIKLAAPIIDTIVPDSGPESGGTDITITGSHFVVGATVTIGGNPADNVNVSFGEGIDIITATTPPGTTGAQDVIVTNPDLQSDTLEGGFTYTSTTTDPGLSTFIIDPNEIVNDGVDFATLTITLRNSNSEVIPNKTVQITHTGSATDIDYLPLADNHPTTPYEWTTDAAGQIVLTLTSNNRAIYEFTATDKDSSADLTTKPQLTVKCSTTSPNDQCVEINITEGTGVLTLTAPDSFTFPAKSSSTTAQNSFTYNADNYTHNLNDVLKVTDTRNSGGFILQVHPSTTFRVDPANCATEPGKCFDLSNFYLATTESDTIPGSVKQDGIEYNLALGQQCGINGAPHDVTGSNLEDANTFTLTTPSSALGTGKTINDVSTLDIMDCTLSAAEGRWGDLAQTVNYYLNIAAFQAPGTYQVTLTFDLTDSTI